MIGKLKHRISIMENKTTENANGFKQKNWLEAKRTWAKIEREFRSKILQNDKQDERQSLFFIVRYQIIDTKHRIAYQGKQYEILRVEDETFEKRFLTIEAKEVDV